MPLISVEAMPGKLDIMQQDSLKGYLREAGSRLFSIIGRELHWTSFSIAFPVFDANSELTHDVVVRIRLNPDPARLQLAAMHALELHKGVIDTLEGADPLHRELRVGISLDCGVEIAWCDENGPI